MIMKKNQNVDSDQKKKLLNQKKIRNEQSMEGIPQSRDQKNEIETRKESRT